MKRKEDVPNIQVSTMKVWNGCVQHDAIQWKGSLFQILETASRHDEAELQKPTLHIRYRF
jgi:hypothetical protein